jgi:hypothetical protein
MIEFDNASYPELSTDEITIQIEAHLLEKTFSRSNEVPADSVTMKTQQSTRHNRLAMGLLLLLIAAIATTIGLLVVVAKRKVEREGKQAFVPGSATSPEPSGARSATASPSFSTTAMPSGAPSALQSSEPSTEPSTHPSLFIAPSRLPTVAPTIAPSASPTKITGIATFYAIGDAPYSAAQAVALQLQMSQLPADADFLIHVGDIREADSGLPCEQSEYSNVASILSQSPIPVFIIKGDNDWNGTYVCIGITSLIL